MSGDRRIWIPASALIWFSALLFVTAVGPNPIRAGGIFDEDFQPPAPAQPDVSRPAPGPSPATAPTTASAPAGATRREIPSKADRTRSRSLLKEVYRKELDDRSLPARKALADKFLNEASHSSNAPSDEFVLLSGAIQAAEDASDLSLSFAAADAMGRDFEVDATGLKAVIVLNISPRQYATHRAENQSVGLELLDALENSGDYAQAERVGIVLQQNCGNDIDRAKIEGRLKTIREKLAGVKRLAPALLELKKSPDDPAANLTAGEYFCLVKGDWMIGAPMLAKGSDNKMKALALLDLAATRAAASGGTAGHDAEVAGDAWWDSATHEATSAWKTAQHDRATYWYQKALPDAGGLVKIRIQKRLKATPEGGSRLINTAKAPEMDAIISEVATCYPNVMKIPGDLELVRVHDGTDMIGSYKTTSEAGSYSKATITALAPARLAIGTDYEPLSAGRYLVVYRIQALGQRTPTPQGKDFCLLEVMATDGNIVGKAHLQSSDFRQGRWLSAPFSVELNNDQKVGFGFFPNTHTICLDRVYIFKLKSN